MVLLDPGFAGTSAIGPQVVSDQQVWNEAVFLQQLPHEFQRRMFAAFSLDQHIEDFAFGIDGAPLMDRTAIDLQIDLIQMPDRGGLGRHLRKSAAIIGPKWFTRRRIVSQETAMPRSARKSSTSRKLRVNRRESPIAR